MIGKHSWADSDLTLFFVRASVVLLMFILWFDLTQNYIDWVGHAASGLDKSTVVLSMYRSEIQRFTFWISPNKPMEKVGKLQPVQTLRVDMRFWLLTTGCMVYNTMSHGTWNLYIRLYWLVMTSSCVQIIAIDLYVYWHDCFNTSALIRCSLKLYSSPPELLQAGRQAGITYVQ